MTTRVKICPQCGKANSHWMEFCKECYMGLIDVAITYEATSGKQLDVTGKGDGMKHSLPEVSSRKSDVAIETQYDLVIERRQTNDNFEQQKSSPSPSRLAVDEAARRPACSSCDSKETAFARQVECAWIHRYELSDLGSSTKRDLIAETVWHIALCQTCAEQRLGESLRSGRLFYFLIGPGLLVASVWVALVRSLVPEGPLDGVAALMFLGCLVGGLIMIPVGFGRAAKATSRLRELKEGGSLTFSDDEIWEAFDTEGKRIIKSLELSKKDFHGDFALPQGERPKKRKGSSYYYEIRRPDEEK